MNHKNCQVCNKAFEALRDNQMFCGYSCSNKSRSKMFINKPICHWCKTEFYRPSPSHIHKFCSKKCEMDFKRKDRITIKCQVCNKEKTVVKSQQKRKFCSRKCMGTTTRERMDKYSPQYRSYGECAILFLLRNNFPNYTYIPNDRKELDGFEIDIWIPDLNVGIEYNGQHHFKPVYGNKVFEKTKWADKTKRIIAHRKGIKIIDVNVNYTISYTNVGKIKLLFNNLCNDLSLKPSNFNVDVKKILEERKIKYN